MAEPKIFGDSFVMSVIEESPQRKEFRALINAIRQASDDGDDAKAEQLKDAAAERLSVFDNVSETPYSDWEWDLAGMHSWFASTLAKYEDAAEWEKKGLTVASRDDQRARNYNNLSDHQLRLGNTQAAVAFAQQAFELWPKNEGIVCNLAMALAKDGRISDSAELIAALAAAGDLNDRKNILAAHLRFEKVLQQAVPSLVDHAENE